MSAGLAPISFPAYETLRPVTELSGVILCDNPSEMTFEGTNTVVLRAPGSPTCVVVDPGPDDRAHAERIAAIVGEIELVVVTHRHGDHTDGIDHLRSFTSAPVRAVEQEFCRDAAPLVDGEELHAAGLDIIVLATPGHTADSVTFLAGPAGAPAAALLPAAFHIRGASDQVAWVASSHDRVSRSSASPSAGSAAAALSSASKRSR